MLRAQQSLVLHQQANSGNSYKVRLAATLSGRKFDRLIEYDTFKGETRTPAFLQQVNKNGRVPVLQIGADEFLPESNAASYYLATGTDLIPTDPFEHAQMLQWMFWEQYSHEPSVAVVRIWIKYIGEANLSDSQKAALPGLTEKARAALKLMDEHLEGREWFVGRRVSVADLVLFAYTHVASDAGFGWEEFPNLQKWCERVKGLKGYVGIGE
ncbi:glutathione S-transferase like protein [Zymoseptoria brevis]|uniref:Glutathione S-transferase like protein n=1 Tax=Zymoseptoria brevis TaxID=1047168 RepID=A0A0F4GAE1_9PEZI|nr:glutathione S-transferase like protein [Zymoseptoria brevis]